MDRDIILELVQRTLCRKLYGLGLPVCTTVLHYLYSNVVPIFDQMILRAAGYDKEEIKSKRLNQSQDLCYDYLHHRWSMVDRYANKTNSFQETSVRVVEMALWVSRGVIEV